MELVGRDNEIETFKHCLSSSESKLIALYGRRRVGKTFLVRKYFEGQMQFELTGLHNGSMEDQLEHFSKTLAKFGHEEAIDFIPETWFAAFDMLGRYIDNIKMKRKKVIFIDELPWLDTPRSKFLTAFENFWNTYCTKRNDLVVIICGSAASWMIKKILKNKGGLHNRVSEKIRLTQFNLYETESFLKAKGIKWGKYDIAQLYLTTGGIPYYLDAVRKGESVVQFVDRTCFQKDGALINEYDVLFKSLFDNSDHHHQIVEALYSRKQGLTRSEIIELTDLKSGGTLTKVLNELEESAFIEVTVPYQMNKTKALYKLADNFTLFYLKFMRNTSRKRMDWQNMVNGQSWKSWSGLAFERLCFVHLRQIKRALKLEAIQSSVSPWKQNNEEQGAQIDLLIDRADRVVNICEIKFSSAEFIIQKDYARKLRNKISLFSNSPGNKRKNCFLTMITTFGVNQNEYYHELVQNEVKLRDLFIK